MFTIKKIVTKERIESNQQRKKAKNKEYYNMKCQCRALRHYFSTSRN